MTGKRLSKTLAEAGVASRRGAEALIFEGRVSVNGQVAHKPEERVSPEKDIIAVDGVEIARSEKKVCYVLHKPKGFVCSSKRLSSSRLVVDLFSHLPYRLFTVGRLDKDTTGLLLVTNDGEFANQIIHPSSDVEKEYLVKVDREVGDEHLKRLSQGGFVDGAFVKPVSVRKVRRGTVKIVVKEGKKHEVRVLVKRCGLRLLELTRIRVGQLVLGTLPVGHYRPIQDRERELVLGKTPTSPRR